jgi:hypothetical protein
MLLAFVTLLACTQEPVPCVCYGNMSCTDGSTLKYVPCMIFCIISGGSTLTLDLAPTGTCIRNTDTHTTPYTLHLHTLINTGASRVPHFRGSPILFLASVHFLLIC